MVEQHRCLDVADARKLDGLLPGGMSPALKTVVLVVGEHGVVDHDVRATDEPGQDVIHRRITVLMIRYDADGFFVIVEPVSAGSTRMVQPRCVDDEVVIPGDVLARGERLELDRFQRLGSHRENRRRHDAADDVNKFCAVLKMTGPGRDFEIRVVSRFEERQSADVVKVRMREQEVELACLRLAQFHSEIAGAGTAIDKDQRVARADFKTGGFSPISQRA